MNWYIGQEIVAVKNHPNNVFKSDDTFTIKGLQKCPCKCGGVEVNIGINHNLGAGPLVCQDCRVKLNNDGVWWFFEKYFAPLDTLCDISELTEILETTKPFEV